MGEVVVTALKRTESVLKVPAAVSVISGADLKTKGVFAVSDIANVVPGVSITRGQDGVQVGIRGIQPSDTSSKGEQDVAFNIDGAYYGRGNARTSAFFDINRVEVLSGPQGTLYGRSSTAGAVNVITNAPILDDYSGYMKAEYGNYNAKRVEGAVNIPLGDVLALRIAGNFNQRDGYSKPVTNSETLGGVTYKFDASNGQASNDQNDETGRVSLLYHPNDNVTARITATGGHQGGVGSGPQVEDILQSGSGDGRYGVLASPVRQFTKNTFFNVDGSLNVKLDGVQLDVLASHQYSHFNQQQDNGNTPAYNGGPLGFTLFNSPTRTSQFEARLSNVNPSKLDYVIGGNYFSENVHEDGHLWLAPAATPSDTSTYANYFEPKNTTSHESYGVFAQGTYHLTNQLSFVGGVRYTADKLDRVGTLALPFFSCVYPTSCAGVPDNGKSDDSKITWRVGVNYQVDPANLLYADIATGFKGGGFNDYDPKTNGTGNYAPASLTAYEVGYKGRPMNNLVVTSDFYYYDFDKDQVSGVVSFPASGQNTPYTVVTPVVFYGWENQVTYRVLPRTTLGGSLALEHSNFVNFQAGGIFGDQVSWAGRPLDQTPTATATFDLDQGLELPDGATLTFHGHMKYSNGYYLSDTQNAVRYWQSAFTRSDLTLTYAPKGDRYSLQLFVNNLEDGVQRTSSPIFYGGAYGGVGGETQVGGLPVYPKPGNGTIGAQTPNQLEFYTNTPRFYGMRVNVKF